jgi:hypothetical protein
VGVKWEEHNFPLKELCRNDENRMLKVEIFESKKNGSRLVGMSEFTLKEIISEGVKLFKAFY